MLDNQNNSDDDKNKVFDLKELYYVISSNKIINLWIVLIIVTFTIFRIYISIPAYKSSSSILIEDNKSQFSLFSDLNMNNGKSEIENEIEIIKSYTVIDRMLQDFIRSGEYKNLFLFNNNQVEMNSFKKLFIQDKKPVDIENNMKINKLIASIQAKMSIYNKRKSDIIEVSITSPDPNESALIINKLIESFKGNDMEWTNGEMIHMKSFLTSQAQIKEDELNYLEKEISNFQKKEQIYGLEGNADLLLEHLTKVEADYYSDLAEKNILSQRKDYYSNQLTEDEKVLADKLINTINDRLLSLRTEIARLESELLSTISLQGEDHIAVGTTKIKLNKLKETLKEQTKLFISQGISAANPIEYRQALMDTILSIQSLEVLYEFKITELDNLIKKYELELSDLSDKVLQFVKLERNRTILSETYSVMMQKLEEAKIGEASKLGRIRIIDLAIPNPKAVEPNIPKILLIGLLISMIFCIFISLLFDYLDNSIRSISDLERHNLEILAMIPTIGRKYSGQGKKKKLSKLSLDKNIERRLITHEDSKSPVSESYRTLRTNLIYRAPSDKGQTILVSSPGPGEGKTTTIANLAITFANLGKRTLLVDTDLRKPVMHTVFNKEQKPGLSDYLFGDETKVENLTHTMDIPNLDLMTSGHIPPFPSELLGSDIMRDFIKEVRKKWDIVLFDLPPLMAVTDAYVILRQMDQFVLVVRANITKKGALKRSIEYLKLSGLNETGVVFNQVDQSKASGDEQFDYYQDYYGKQ